MHACVYKHRPSVGILEFMCHHNRVALDLLGLCFSLRVANLSQTTALGIQNT